MVEQLQKIQIKNKAMTRFCKKGGPSMKRRAKMSNYHKLNAACRRERLNIEHGITVSKLQGFEQIIIT